MNTQNSENPNPCNNHQISYKNRYLLIAWNKKVKCKICQLKLEIKEPYKSLFETLFALILIFMLIVLWAKFGFWVAVILTFIVSQVYFALVATLIPLSTDRGIKKLK